VPAVSDEDEEVDARVCRRHGRLTAREQADVFRRGLAEVVGPCAAALLATVAHRQSAASLDAAVC
jgi:hypothetical protein